MNVWQWFQPVLKANTRERDGIFSRRRSAASLGSLQYRLAAR
jgi:hypothetical protein